MRLLHTADWHLGQNLHGFDRADEHAAFLDWLLDTLERERADALLIAGDVFDQANPSAQAQRQLYAFLAAAVQRRPGLDIVLIAGNHDSPGRLEAIAPLAAAFGVHVIGHTHADVHGHVELERLLLPLHDTDGAVAAWCLAVPFLRPADVPRSSADEAGAAYAAGVARLYAELDALAQTRRAAGQALVALGHCHLHGGAISQHSERRLLIGNAEALPSTLFAADLDYVALGHLHRAQRIGEERLRYAGSPLPLSFAEVDYPHQVLRVDFTDGRLSAVEALRVPRSRALLRLPAAGPAPLEAVLAELAATRFPSPAPYLEVRVRLDAPQPGLRPLIEDALKGHDVRLARIDSCYAQTSTEPEAPAALERLDPAEVFARRYRMQFAAEPPEDYTAAFAELLQAVQHAEDAR